MAVLTKITTRTLADNSVTAAKIQADTIVAGDLAPNSVTASELANDAVDTAALADESVDEATETAIFDDKKNITSIGTKHPNANGHFIGLMKLEKEGSKKFKDLFLNSKKNSTMKTNDLNKNLSFEKLRIVDLLQGLIKRNYSINSILIDNGWLEFDTMNDYELYSDMLTQNTLSKMVMSYSHGLEVWS